MAAVMTKSSSLYAEIPGSIRIAMERDFDGLTLRRLVAALGKEYGELMQAGRARPPVPGRRSARPRRPLHPITGRAHPYGLCRKNDKAACLRTPRPRQPCCCSEAYDQFAENPERFSNKYTLANIV